ncbi:MAG: hypothetical protein EZS28_040117, partial [Streblomastix strix]
MDATHFEYINISKTQSTPISITGGATQDEKSIRTSWTISAQSDNIIYLNNGELTLHNLEFNYTKISSTILPAVCLIEASESRVYYKALTVTSCVFNGLGLGSSDTVRTMIIAYYLDSLTLRDDIFQNAHINGSRYAVYSVSNKTRTAFFVERSQFLNIQIETATGQGALVITLAGTNQTAFINQCNFTNCSCISQDSISGAIYLSSNISSASQNQYIVSNNIFIGNSGHETGALYATGIPSRNSYISNQFSDNKKSGSDQKGCDSSMLWPDYTETQTIIEARERISNATDVEGYVNINPTIELCKSKELINSNCMCDPYSTAYSHEQCLNDKVCVVDIVNQNNTTCPCLSTGDPRAGKGQCPAYCVKGNVTTNCTCDSNIINYTVQQCQQEKLCTFNLSNQTNATCPCLNTSDPRAGKGQCPAYCVKGKVDSTCVCDTNLTDYTFQQCQTEKKCITDLINQNNLSCPCLSTGDPRAGKGQCPAYCTAKDKPTTDCVCDSGPNASYPYST